MAEEVTPRVPEPVTGQSWIRLRFDKVVTIRASAKNDRVRQRRLRPASQLSSIYLYVVDSRTISHRLLVGAQTLAHSGNDLRNRGVFRNSFSIAVAGRGPCAARAYRLRELCERSE